MASNSDSNTNMNMSNIGNGIIIAGSVMYVAWCLVGAGTIVELTKIGDRKEYKESEKSELLHEASKYRRISQYNSVLLQRKSPCC
jgi:hypothetical protein